MPNRGFVSWVKPWGCPFGWFSLAETQLLECNRLAKKFGSEILVYSLERTRPACQNPLEIQFRMPAYLAFEKSIRIGCYFLAFFFLFLQRVSSRYFTDAHS